MKFAIDQIIGWLFVALGFSLLVPGINLFHEAVQDLGVTFPSFIVLLSIGSGMISMSSTDRYTIRRTLIAMAILVWVLIIYTVYNKGSPFGPMAAWSSVFVCYCAIGFYRVKG
jgi:hypothetical protein